MNKVLFSKNSDNWSTPKEFLCERGYENYFDPCPLNANFDGLTINWKSNNFVNPPYSDIGTWVIKAIFELLFFGNRSVLLVPARTDTKWFHELVYNRYKIEFLKGRLKFGGSKNSAPFPSMLIFIE